MRKIISVLLSAVMLFSGVSVFASRYSDVTDGAVYSAAIENLSNLGVVSGYNGMFNPGGYITRAEAAKIASVVAGIDDEATAKSGIKKFNDVEIGQWSTGYINAVADNGYILGYPNGYYMPNNNITYAEMTTIVLRLLGYNSTVLGDNWPFAYMYKANELGITDGLSLGDYDLINRAQTCQLIDNALSETVYGKNEKLLSVVSAIKYSDPIVIKSTDPYMSLASLGINPSNIGSYSIIRDKKAARVSDIQIYDVVYLSKSNNTIYVYCDKISGVYKEAFPSKNAVTSVDISGNILELETQGAADRLGEKANSYKYNSRITVLLGKDGKIVDAVDMNSAGNSEYGVLLSISETVSEDTFSKGEQKTYINILSGNGQSVSYETKKDYSNYIGLVGKVSFNEDGTVTFKTVTSTEKVGGAVDKARNKIGDTYLTADATLIELVYEPETHTGTAIAKVIDIDDIAVDEIYSSNVVYALRTGDFGDVSFAVLKNVSNDNYVYGVLTESNVNTAGMNVSSFYKVITNGVEKSYNASFGQNIDKGMPVAMILENGALKSIYSLKSAARSKLNAIDGLRIKVGETVVEMAEDAQIYYYSLGKGFTSLSESQAKEYIGKTASVFVDAKTVSGGMARVIIIYE